MSKRAPGPPGHWLLGNLPAFRRDVLDLMLASARDYGDVVRFRLGPIPVHLINHPDFIDHVLRQRADNYDKDTRSSVKISAICGDSLLTSNHEPWRRQRRLLQPAFHHQHIAGFAATMTRLTATMLERWPTGESLDVASEMMQLTYNIVGKTLLGADVGADSQAVEQAMDILLTHTFARWGRIIDCPTWLPTSGNRRFRQALATVDRIVYRIIDEHRCGNGEPDDLLSLLLQVRDEQTGEGLSDAELRNQAITFLLAGHETTANALAWTFYLIAQHPEVEQQLRAELRTVLHGKTPALEDVANLKYTTMVIQESMRLYPPIWAIERHAIAADEIGGFHIPAGSSVVISPYVLHRHPKFWTAPDKFNPERFRERPGHAYLPFGVGPRFCIGNEFAMLEARLIVSMVIQACRLKLVSGQAISPNPSITLRPRHGVQMRVRMMTE